MNVTVQHETPSVSNPSQEAALLLRRAASLHRLARCFVYPTPGHRKLLLGLFEEAPPGDRLAELVDAWRSTREEILRAEYCRLFLGAAPCPPNETAWGDARRLGGVSVELADLQGFYRAFGFGLSPEGGDMPDHVSTELEFLALLLVKTAYACLQGWREQYDVTLRAARTFLETHPASWIASFLEQLRKESPPDAYLRPADALDRAVREECKLLGARVGQARPAPEWPSQPDSFVCPQVSGLPSPPEPFAARRAPLP